MTSLAILGALPAVMDQSVYISLHTLPVYAVVGTRSSKSATGAS